MIPRPRTQTRQRQQSGYIDARWFGVVGDGSTNDTTAMQAALNACPTGGVVWHSGKSVVGNLTIPANVTLLGGIKGLDATADNIYFYFSDLNSALYTTAGTTITLNYGAAIVGCFLSPSAIAGANQSTTASFAGVALTVNGHGVCISNNIILGYETAIYSSGEGRVRIDWNAIDAQNGIYVAGTFDSTRIVFNHCWPYLTHQSYWLGGAVDKTKLYRTGVGLSLEDGSDDTQVDGNLFNGFLVGIQLDSVTAVNMGRNWIDHPRPCNRANNYGVWFKNNVTDITVQTLLIYGPKIGLVAEMLAGEQVRIDILHIDSIDDVGVSHSAGNLFIDFLEVQSTGSAAVSIGSTSINFEVGSYNFTDIGAASPIALPPSCATNIVRIGPGQWDGAAGSSLIGVNTLTFPTLASATTLALPVNGDTFYISGTTNITSITGGWGGRKVRLIFTDVLTVTDGLNLTIAGNFVTSQWDVLNLIYDGNSQWLEESRSAN